MVGRRDAGQHRGEGTPRGVLRIGAQRMVPAEHEAVDRGEEVLRLGTHVAHRADRIRAGWADRRRLAKEVVEVVDLFGLVVAGVCVVEIKQGRFRS